LGILRKGLWNATGEPTLYTRACLAHPGQLGIKRVKYLDSIPIVLLLAGSAIAGDTYECSYFQNGSQDLATEGEIVNPITFTRSELEALLK
jgi:hypothetical protein